MLWAEAVMTAAYVLNRTISKQLNGRTAYENWFGRKSEIKHLRFFGCDAYKNIPNGQRKKFDPKSKKMILILMKQNEKQSLLGMDRTREILYVLSFTFQKKKRKQQCHSLSLKILPKNLLKIIMKIPLNTTMKKHQRLEYCVTGYNCEVQNAIMKWDTHL
ncbi:hypothetical protein KM043_016105 [Ampulex compressa]|nr:hypothetical protein KM043_016105 [Ampulex compressa]